jgi:beta-glucanase (GH16 family)
MKPRAAVFRLVSIATLVLAAACTSASSQGNSAGDGGGDDSSSWGGTPSQPPADDASADDAAPPAWDAGVASDAAWPHDAAAWNDAPGSGPIQDAAPSIDTGVAGYTLTWSDEFNGPDGTPPDPTKWTYDIGGSGWGNQEREYYTNALENAQQQGGNLVITATPDGASSQQCWYGTCEYTSARLNTSGIFSQAYGRFETRAQMPFGQGLWPAIWMLGSNISSVSWPACGEIDFLETIGSDIAHNHGSRHAPNYNPSGTYALPGGGTYDQAFHTFAVEWDPGEVRFYVDDTLYETQDQSGVGGGTWEFDHPFFLIMNVAVGGNWPGDPDQTTTFPQTMKVDWVRVYSKNP